jgi:predicted RNase H-like HicB family nuclease
MSRQFMVYVEWDAESKTYIGTVPGIRGAHSCADTLEELRANMKEVLELVLVSNASTPSFPTNFVGIYHICS